MEACKKKDFVVAFAWPLASFMCLVYNGGSISVIELSMLNKESINLKWAVCIFSISVNVM